jgi:hypothetical protein
VPVVAPAVAVGVPEVVPPAPALVGSSVEPEGFDWTKSSFDWASWPESLAGLTYKDLKTLGSNLVKATPDCRLVVRGKADAVRDTLLGVKKAYERRLATRERQLATAAADVAVAPVAVVAPMLAPEPSAADVAEPAAAADVAEREEAPCRWLAAGCAASHQSVPKERVGGWTHATILEPYFWPSILLAGEPFAVKTTSGLRTQQAEELYQMWRQLVAASETEATGLLSAMEDIILACSCIAVGDSPSGFFTQHRDRFLRAKKITLAVEVRLVDAMDPFVGRQMAIRANLSSLPISAMAMELVAKSKLDLSAHADRRRPRSSSPRRSPRRRDRGDRRPPTSADKKEKVCKYCDRPVPGNIFQHFKICEKAKRF